MNNSENTPEISKQIQSHLEKIRLKGDLLVQQQKLSSDTTKLNVMHLLTDEEIAYLKSQENLNKYSPSELKAIHEWDTIRSTWQRKQRPTLHKQRSQALHRRQQKTLHKQRQQAIAKQKQKTLPK